MNISRKKNQLDLDEIAFQYRHKDKKEASTGKHLREEEQGG